MGAYGYSIEHILMVDIIPDASVRKAMNEINAGNGLFSIFLTIFLCAHGFPFVEYKHACLRN